MKSHHVNWNSGMEGGQQGRNIIKVQSITYKFIIMHSAGSARSTQKDKKKKSRRF